MEFGSAFGSWVFLYGVLVGVCRESLNFIVVAFWSWVFCYGVRLEFIVVAFFGFWFLVLIWSWSFVFSIGKEKMNVPALPFSWQSSTFLLTGEEKEVLDFLSWDFTHQKERSDEVLRYDGEVVKLLLDIVLAYRRFCGDFVGLLAKGR